MLCAVMYSSLEQVASITILFRRLCLLLGQAKEFRFPGLLTSGEVLGTPEAGVTPRSPPPQYFLPYVNCVVTYHQSVAVWICFLNCSGLKAQISYESS